MSAFNKAPSVYELPPVCRLASVRRIPVDAGYQMNAGLYFDGQTYPVVWTSQHPDVRLRSGVMVSPRLISVVGRHDHAQRIARVVLLERPERYVNLFDTIPPEWIGDPELLQRAASIWANLPLPFQELINTLLWEGSRMRRFCVGPSSMRGHHCENGGNFRHAVETAEMMQALLPRFPTADGAVAITAGLIHDLAKADDYERASDGKWVLSDWGKLVAHRNTILIWIGEAASKLRCPLSDRQRKSLLHALTATPGMPKWTGLRTPMSPEAMMLSLADRASGKGDLLAAQQGETEGWGLPHPHLENEAPFALKGAATKRGRIASLDRLHAQIRTGELHREPQEKKLYF